MDVTQALKDTENSLRDFIAVVLRKVAKKNRYRILTCRSAFQLHKRLQSLISI